MEEGRGHKVLVIAAAIGGSVAAIVGISVVKTSYLM